MKWIAALFYGFEQPFLGLDMLRREKRLRGYMAIPIGLNIALFLLLLTLLWVFRVDLIGIFYAQPNEGFWHLALWYVVGVLLFGVFFVLSYFLFTPIGCLLASPFNDALAGRAEQIFDPNVPLEDIPFSFAGLPGMLLRELIKLSLALIVAVTGLVLSLFPVLGQLLGIAFMASFGSFVFALEYLDYPMNRHRYRLRDVARAIQANFWHSIGFGGAALLLLLIPFVNLFCIPACVIGATRLFVDFRREGRLPPLQPASPDTVAASGTTPME